IGHRGNRAHAPENTVESLKQALALGVDAVEFDVRVSRDGVLVVMHDPTLERTTNASGPVSALTVAALRDIDAGANFTCDGGRTFPYRGRNIGVPTFDEAVDAVRDVPMIIELKIPETTDLIRDAVKRHNIAHRVVVAGFDSQTVHPLRGADFPLGATTEDSIRLLPGAFLRRSAPPKQFHTVNIPPTWNGWPVPFRLLTRSLKSQRIPIHVWTINTAVEAERLWDNGVCGIISDDPATIIKARNTRYGAPTR
ncbi:MAG: glycerophosphodiester phosphodiesterase family protein, partial [Gemmatimonadaceae bacterium]